MIVKVKYYNDEIGGYAGQEYTYRTNLAVQPYTKVLAPVKDGELKKALITQVDLPESTIDPAWAERIKWIKEYDNGEG